MDETLSESDAADILEELLSAQNQSYILGLKLKLPLHEVEAIDLKYLSPRERLLHVIIAFLRQAEPRPTWRVIVEALRNPIVNLPALARSVEAAHVPEHETLATQQCLGETPTSAAVNLTPDLPSSPATTPEASGPQTSGSSPSDPSLGPVARPLPPSSPSDRVSQVRAEIDRLSDTFSDLMFDAQEEMCMRESADPAFFKRFRERLLDLPVAKRAPHAKFFDMKLDEFLKAENTRKIFAILRRYCNYRKYAVLREVVRNFCEAVLQRRMQEYCESLEKFEKATTVDVYLKAIEASDVLSSEFTKMTVKINKPASECTLHEVRKITEAIAEKASLQSYSVYVGDISES